MASPQPHRFRPGRQPARLADHRRRPRLPRHAARAQGAPGGTDRRRAHRADRQRVPEENPAEEAELADSIGLAMLVVLETLSPAERIAFVLHDMFSVPFSEIGEISGRSADAARQLASRARRRVRGRGSSAGSRPGRAARGRRRLPGGRARRGLRGPARAARSGRRPARPHRRGRPRAGRRPAVGRRAGRQAGAGARAARSRHTGARRSSTATWAWSSTSRASASPSTQMTITNGKIATMDIFLDRRRERP